MEYQNINTFAKTPRNIPKEDLKFFLKNNGNTGKWLIICLIGGIVLAIITFILYLFSINPVWIPIACIIFSTISYFSLSFLDPKIEKLNNYPLVMGYVLTAHRSLWDKDPNSQGGSLIIFTKEEKLRLDEEFITSIGEKIINFDFESEDIESEKDLESIKFLYTKISDFQKGKSVFNINIQKPIKGVKIYCSYVILDGKNLPDNKIPKSQLIPCLIDENNTGIAIPYKLIKYT